SPCGASRDCVPDPRTTTPPPPRQWGRSHVSSASGALALATVQVRRTDLATAQQVQALGEQFLEFGDRAAFEEHVPVRAHGLGLLRLGLDATDVLADLAGLRVLPRGRDVGLVGHRDGERVAVVAHVLDLLTRSHLDAALVLETLRPETRSTQ